MMYDVVIIGAGPAGISAGIYAASRGKKVLITEKNTVGGLIGKVSTVTHYAGIMTEETGSSFAKRLKIQAENTGIDIIYEEVTQVELQGSIKKVFTKDGAYDAKKIVLANGTTPRKLNIPGEAELTGKGMGMNAQRDGRKYTDKNIYVVGSQQNLHFQQLKAILKEMGYDWADDCIHVPFGMVSLPEGTLSTRRGKVVYLEDVLNRATEKVDDILREREEKNGYTMENREELARQVGIGAVKFQELFNQRIKDYVFDWDRTLSFDGETGPYVQYTHARMHSLLEKGAFDPAKSVDVKALTLDDEKELLQQLYGFNQVIVDSHEKYEPYLVTRYITECAKTFNKYYTNTPILVEDDDIKNARLLLVYGVKNMIKIGLNLLGIEAPNKM